MDTIIINIPEDKTPYISKIIKEVGGEIVSINKKATIDEVTHGVFFGENIKRVIKAFRN